MYGVENGLRREPSRKGIARPGGNFLAVDLSLALRTLWGTIVDAKQ